MNQETQAGCDSEVGRTCEVGGYGTVKWRVSVAAEHVGMETSALKVWVWIIVVQVAIKARGVLGPLFYSTLYLSLP